MKLTYFNAKGLAETSRLILAIAGITYEDFRYPIEVVDQEKHIYKRDEFEADKAAGLLNNSMGKLPSLTTDNGIVICQSKTIERYLANLYGLMGSTPEESARIDSICEIVRDMKDSYFKVRSEGPSAAEEYFKKTLPVQFIALGKFLATRPSGVFAVGNKLSLADITIYSFVHEFFTNKDLSYAACCRSIRIKSIVDNVASLDSVKNWNAVRPNTLF
jgi:glutathione S-transferase